MRAVDIIERKRDGIELSADEIKWFIEQYNRGEIPDYQTAAWLMAIYFSGMSASETVSLTQAMAQSGHMMDLSDIADYAVDKHSSGGVGDKTTLIVLPLVASFGVPVAKMSGRGLGFSGGTLDKLESIKGYNVSITDEKFKELARKNGIVLCGQTGDLAPADGKLYALRDVTGTVPSIPLIAASIMSKKLASGAQGIVLDVKVGSGAFMQNLDDAHELAKIMVEIGRGAGRDVIALISDMNQPLGRAVGNAVEVREAIATLRGGGPDDLVDHCVTVAQNMLALYGRGEKWTNEQETQSQLREHLQNGKALDKFRLLVESQGGDSKAIDDPDLLPQAEFQEPLVSGHTGYISAVDAGQIARATLVLGAGREKKGDPIDPAVGVEIDVNVGDAISAGDQIATIHASDERTLEEAKVLINRAVEIDESPVDPLPLFYDRIDSRD